MRDHLLTRDRMTTKRFDPSWTDYGSINLDDAEQYVRNEPMLFNCDRAAAGELGGPLTMAFLLALNRMGQNGDCIIDSRVHMLKRDWFPCIPGWHIDDFHRGADGQPDLDTVPTGAFHVMCLVGDCSLTEFLDSAVTLPNPPSGEVAYGWYNRHIRHEIGKGVVEPMKIESGRLVRFGMRDFHRGTPATKDGWRWFIRASFGTERKATNEVRKQVQVYLPTLEAGW